MAINGYQRHGCGRFFLPTYGSAVACIDNYGGGMSKQRYESFRKGLQAGISALWRPHFMSGVRNGGFEQTLRNVCMPYIEDATGRMAFTEADERADVVLRSVKAGDAASTRCEFKTNFACQLPDIEKRSKKAIDQATPRAPAPDQDGIAVYAVSELVMVDKATTSVASLHNAFVRSPPYKLFREQSASDEDMGKVGSLLRVHDNINSEYAPLFPSGLCELWLHDGSGFARLHVWTYYIPAQSAR